MAENGSKKDRLWAKAVAALLTEPTLEQAALAVGTTEKTLRRWMTDEAFLQQYRLARQQLVEGAIARIQSATGRALDTLLRNLTCGKPAAEVRAAVAILDRAVDGVERHLDLDRRIAALERKENIPNPNTANRLNGIHGVPIHDEQ
jgi:hypothetical protein